MTDTAQGGGLRHCKSATRGRSRAGRDVCAGKTGPSPMAVQGGWATFS